MKEFDVVCPLGREPRKAEIESAAGGLEYVLRKRSVDARKEPVWRYHYEAYGPGERPEEKTPDYQDVSAAAPVIVAGAGPAGLFAALRLLERGFKPIILERGKAVKDRRFDVAALSREGVLDPDSNYCYGEGGAGAFSDGKLYTRSSKRGDVGDVLRRFVSFGASPDILIDAHPHIGSDKLPFVVENIRKCIEAHGGEYHFGTRVVSIEGEPGNFKVGASSGESFSGIAVILATGHSARDVYEMLHSRGGALEAKGFALGVRVEHPQEKINWAQYHGAWKPGFPAAEYSFAEQQDGRGVFSFCMCPGGILVPSSTENGTVVLNGMSNSSRNGRFANAGVVVQIDPGDIPGDSPFRLMDFQQGVERKMYAFCSSFNPSNPFAAPAQRMEDFCVGRITKNVPETTYHPGAISAPLHQLLPPMVAERLRKVFPRVRIRNYYTNSALLLGVESRTSSPVRIPRDPETLQYVSAPGIFPAGEGAGYSGGIVSSAIDGIRCADSVQVH